MKTCTICLIPENFPNAHINAAGVCSYCRKNKAKPDCAHEEGRFKALIKEIVRSNESGHDCLVCYSGGKDSTYTLIQTKEKYGLRPLAFTLDNGYISKTAKENIRRICKALKVDLVTIRPNARQMDAIFKVALSNRLFANQVAYRLSAVCYACITYVNYQAISLALEKDLRIIISGFTHGQVPKAVFAHNPELLQETFSDMKKRLSSTVNFDINTFYPSIDFTKFKGATLYNVNPILFEDYDEAAIIKKIKKYGWERPADVDMCSTNCLMNRAANFYHYRMYGYHPYQYEVSNLIRMGSVSKAEGRKICSDINLDRNARDIIKRLGLKE